uniref:Amino_oxidase domain-containing protein n=1 Tax=Haemonchus contortus TaxID=6289 RepID=A0A7I4YTZ2_HAECO
MPELPCRVAIVGAGFAGLSAAAVLERNGVDYVVFEGANRVGGRVYSVPYEDGWLQHGAEFINGEKNEIFRIANEKQLTVQYVRDFDLFCTNVVYGFSGKNVDKSLVKDWLDFVNDIEEQFAAEALDRSDMSVAERFHQLYEQWISRDEFKKHKAIFDRLARLYLTYYEIEWSSPANELALLNFADWDDGGSEPRSFTLKKKGFRDILEDIKIKVPEDRIKLNCPVTKVKYSEGGATLCFSDGEEHRYDHVIVTCSLGYLKRNHTSFFCPPLDPGKTEAILSLGFGNMMKVFLEYTKPWWPHDANAIAPLESHSNLAESFPMLQPLYWNKKILVAWVSGKGPDLISRLEDEELVDGLTHHLREALGDPTIPYPVKIYRHSWITDPLVGGSYSYLTPDSVKYVPDAFVRMAEPITIGNKPVVCFAGEHTHATMYQTTIGAYESGEREAYRIIKHLSSKTH